MNKKRLRISLCCVCLLLGMSACTKEAKDSSKKPTAKEENNIKKVSLTFTGDILIEAANYAWMNENYALGNYFEQVKPYMQSDLVIGNQEVPIGGEELGISGIAFEFNAPAQIASEMKKAGFDILTFANNHSYDRGVAGIQNTIKNLTKEGIATTGAFANKEDRDIPLLMERNGVKIAVLSYTYDTNQWMDEEHTYMVNKFLNANHEFDEEHKQLLKEDVKNAQEKADVVIVAMHWGNEFTYDLNTQQQEASAYLNELGVDIIVGNHPHTLQSVATLSSSTGKKTFVMYSLGNLLSGAVNVDRASEQFTNMYEVGGIVTCDLLYDIENKQLAIKNKKMHPYVIQIDDAYSDFKLIPFSQYNEDLAAAHYQRYFSADFTYEYVKDQLKYLFQDKISWQ